MSSPEPSEDKLRANDERPWLGLRSFTELDADYFHGRTAELTDLLLRVLRQPLTVLFSQSGLGKTSLLAAGLIPALRNEAHRPVLLRLRFDEDAPLLTDQLHQALDVVLPDADGAVRSASLWGRLHHRPLVRNAEFQHNPPVLILDQFEEIFTLGMERCPEEARRCLNQLAELVENRVPAALLGNTAELLQNYDRMESPLRIVLALREDYLFHLDAWRVPMPSLMRNRMSLAMLRGPQALEAVLQPAARTQPCIITEGAAEAIVRFVAQAAPGTDIKDIAAVPPLLSLVCAELNEARIKRGAVTIQKSDVVGNADQILHDYYERCFAGQPAALRQLVEDQLVTKSGHRDSRARESFESDLIAAGVSDASAALDRLIQPHRLLSTDERARQPRIELTHDVLASIVHASREKRREREASEQARQALALEAAKQRRRRLAVASMAALSCLAVCGAIYGLWQARLARQALEDRRKLDAKLGQQVQGNARAAMARTKGAVGMNDRFTHYADALRYAEALGDGPLKEEVREYWNRHYQALETLQSIPAQGPMKHEGYLWSVRYSKSGQYLVTCCQNGPVRIWDAKTATEVMTLPSDTRSAYFADYHPQGNEIIVLGGTNTSRAQRWTLDISKRNASPQGEAQILDGSAWCASYSADGKFIALGCSNGEVRLWNLASGEAPAKARMHAGGVNQVSFAQDGKFLLTASMDKTMGFWDTSDSAVKILSSHPDRVRAAALAGPSFLSYSACDDGKVRVLNPASGQPLDQLRSTVHPKVWWLDITADALRLATAGIYDLRVHDLFAPVVGEANLPMRALNMSIYADSIIKAVSLSPDGLQAAIGLDTGKVFIWDLVPEKRAYFTPSLRLRHPVWTRGVAFSPDGNRIFTTGGDTKLRSWDSRTGRLLEQIGDMDKNGQNIKLTEARVQGVSPLLAITITDSSPNFYVWDGEGRTLRSPGLKEGPTVWDAVMSPDGRTLATCDKAKQLTIYEQKSLKQRWQTKFKDELYRLAYSADGSTLAVSENAVLHLFKDFDQSLGSPADLTHHAMVTACEFHPRTPERLATGDLNGRLYLWQQEKGKWTAWQMVLAEKSSIYDVAYSADGKRVAVASVIGASGEITPQHTGFVAVLDAEKGDLLWSVNLLAAALEVAFSPDGQRLAFSSFDGVTRVSDLTQHSTLPLPMDLEMWAQSRVLDGKVIGMPMEERMKWRDQRLTSTGEDEWSRFWRWKLAAPRTRTVTYHSSLSVSDYIERELTWIFGHDSRDSYAITCDAYAYDPAHPLIMLSRALVEPKDTFWRKSFLEPGIRRLEDAEKAHAPISSMSPVIVPTTQAVAPTLQPTKATGHYHAKAAAFLHLSQEPERAKELFAKLIKDFDPEKKTWGNAVWVQNLDDFDWPQKLRQALVELGK